MTHLEGIVDYPYKSSVKKTSHVCGIQTPDEPHRVVLPDYRYVPERLIIKPFNHSQKEAMIFNVKK